MRKSVAINLLWTYPVNTYILTGYTEFSGGFPTVAEIEIVGNISELEIDINRKRLLSFDNFETEKNYYPFSEDDI